VGLGELFLVAGEAARPAPPACFPGAPSSARAPPPGAGVTVLCRASPAGSPPSSRRAPGAGEGAERIDDDLFLLRGNEPAAGRDGCALLEVVSTRRAGPGDVDLAGGGADEGTSTLRAGPRGDERMSYVLGALG
jgi:hypothetical protein